MRSWCDAVSRAPRASGGVDRRGPRPHLWNCRDQAGHGDRSGYAAPRDRGGRGGVVGVARCPQADRGARGVHATRTRGSRGVDASTPWRLPAGSPMCCCTTVLVRSWRSMWVYGQLVWKPRPTTACHVHDRTNVRSIDAETIGGPVDSSSPIFPSSPSKLVLPVLVACVNEGADLVPMVKPQFEVGKDRVGAGGVVRDPELRVGAVLEVAEAAAALGLQTLGAVASPLPGPSGNVEYFLWLRRATRPRTPTRRKVRAARFGTSRRWFVAQSRKVRSDARGLARRGGPPDTAGGALRATRHHRYRPQGCGNLRARGDRAAPAGQRGRPLLGGERRRRSGRSCRHRRAGGAGRRRGLRDGHRPRWRRQLPACRRTRSVGGCARARYQSRPDRVPRRGGSRAPRGGDGSGGPPRVSDRASDDARRPGPDRGQDRPARLGLERGKHREPFASGRSRSRTGGRRPSGLGIRVRRGADRYTHRVHRLRVLGRRAHRVARTRSAAGDPEQCARTVRASPRHESESIVAVETVADSHDGLVFCDGRRTLELPAGARVEVVRGKDPIRWVRLDSAPFADRMVRKFELPVTGWRGRKR